MGEIEDWKGVSDLVDHDLYINQDVFRIGLTETLYQLMIDQGLTEADLAEKMGTSKSAVTQLLSGDQDITVDAVSELAHHLNHCPTVEFRRLRSRKSG